MKNQLYEKLVTIAGEQNVLKDEPMKKHTTFRIGGNADFFVTPDNAGKLKEVILACAEGGIPYYIMGNGSNLLVGDKGYRGVVIQNYKNRNEINVEGSVITAQSGALLSAVAKKACEAGLEGFEFAAGIPGTLGGAVVMNAGAYGGEMQHVLKNATVLTKEGEMLELTAKELKLGYRTSIILEKEYVVLEAQIGLTPGNKEEIQAKIKELQEKRVSKQPLEYPSAGSTFMRPEGYFAGKLIMDAGLRGYTIGGAMVSDKHCGFVINKGNATAKDVLALIHHIRDEVFRQFGVELHAEVKMLGDF